MREIKYDIYTVKELKYLIKNLPDEMPVLADCADKTIRPITGFNYQNHDIGNGEERIIFLEIMEWIE